MAFFTALTEAIASRQSLFVAGLDPNPEMLRNWAGSRDLAGRSLLSQARAWCKAVIEATADHVCAYKPSLGFYQAMGSAGLELLMEVRELLPPDLPLIIDSKHGEMTIRCSFKWFERARAGGRQIRCCWKWAPATRRSLPVCVPKLQSGL